MTSLHDLSLITLMWLAACALVLGTAVGVVVVAALRSAARLSAAPRPRGRRTTHTARKTPHTAARIPAPRQPTWPIGEGWDLSAKFGPTEPPAALADTIRAELGALGCTCSTIRPEDDTP